MKLVLDESDLYQAVWLLLESRGFTASGDTRATLFYRKEGDSQGIIRCEVAGLPEQNAKVSDTSVGVDAKVITPVAWFHCTGCNTSIAVIVQEWAREDPDPTCPCCEATHMDPSTRFPNIAGS